MQHFRTLFTIAFAMALAALAISFIISLRQQEEKSDYLWYDTLQQLNELGRAKYRQSHRYNEVARHAELDKQSTLASLMRALAYADNVQCNNCRKAIESLGGVFHTPILLPAEQREPLAHLHDALNNKYSLHEGLTAHCLHRVTKEGNRYIARLITWCDASDIMQIALLEQHIDTLHHRTLHTLRVCPGCGAIEQEPLHCHLCPHCLTESSQFALFK